MAERSLSCSLPRTWPSRQRRPFRLLSEPRPPGRNPLGVAERAALGSRRGPLGVVQRAALGGRRAPLGVAQRAALGGRRAPPGAVPCSLEGIQVLLGVAQRTALGGRKARLGVAQRAAMAGRRSFLGSTQVLLGLAQLAQRGVADQQAIRPYTRERAMTGKFPTYYDPRAHPWSCDLTGKASDDKDGFCRCGVFRSRRGTLRDCGASDRPIRTCQYLCILAESVPENLYFCRFATRPRGTHHSLDRGPHTKVLVPAW